MPKYKYCDICESRPCLSLEPADEVWFLKHRWEIPPPLQPTKAKKALETPISINDENQDFNIRTKNHE